MGVGQFIKSSLLDTCTFFWSVLVGYNLSQTRTLTEFWPSITQSSGQTTCSWITFRQLLYWGMGTVSSRRRKSICGKEGTMCQLQKVHSLFVIVPGLVNCCMRDFKWVPKHKTKRSQRFSIVSYYQTQQRCRCSDAPTKIHYWDFNYSLQGQICHKYVCRRDKAHLAELCQTVKDIHQNIILYASLQSTELKSHLDKQPSLKALKQWVPLFLS